MKNGIAQKEVTKGQFKEFVGAVVACLPEDGFDAQYFIEPHHHKELREALRNIFVPQTNPINNSDYADIIADWQKFYLEVFNLTVDFSQVLIPSNANTKLNFLQFMAQGLTYQQAHDKEKEKYPKYWDWDDNWPNKIDMDFEERTTDKNYPIWHSGNAEADEIYKNKSADWILKKRIKTMTRLEGAVFGLYMLWKRNIIIDQKVVSLWSGSRDTAGSVPYSHWFSAHGRFRSYWCTSGGANDGLRPRPVVS